MGYLVIRDFSRYSAVKIQRIHSLGSLSLGASSSRLCLVLVHFEFGRWLSNNLDRFDSMRSLLTALSLLVRRGVFLFVASSDSTSATS
jgi:hypothetical protein